MVQLTRFAQLVLVFAVWFSAIAALAAPVTGWMKDTSFGDGPTAQLTEAGGDSPILGSGAANNADNTAIYAAMQLVSLENGQRLTLSGSAQMIGTSANPDFRWGLFKDDGVGAVTGGWLGFIATAEGNTWAKDPSGTNFANTTFASVASGRGSLLGNTESNGVAFGPGTYEFNMAVERYDDEIDVLMSITNASSGFTIASPAFTETDPARQTFAFDRVGFLAGGSLDADQIRFSDIDVTVSQIQRPTLEVHSSGLVVMTNPTGQSFDVNQYEITSNADSLNPEGWESFDSRENDDPVGSGWDEAGGNSGVLAEVNLLDAENLSVGERHSLGHAFAPGGDPDLAFRFTTPGAGVLRGVVSYVQSGDYNRDGAVDAADYIVWRKTDGASVPAGADPDGDGNGQVNGLDYDVFRSNFGRFGGSGASQSFAVPEPSVGAIMFLAMTCLLQRSEGRTRRFDR